MLKSATRFSFAKKISFCKFSNLDLVKLLIYIMNLNI